MAKEYSDDIIASKVADFWKEIGYAMDVIVFFLQKYECDKDWEEHEELVMPKGFADFENMTFLNDFCEGQTMVKNIKIVPLDDVVEFYREKHIRRDKE